MSSYLFCRQCVTSIDFHSWNTLKENLLHNIMRYLYFTQGNEEPIVCHACRVKSPKEKYRLNRYDHY